MTLWFDTPDPVPIAEAAEFGQRMLRERDRAMDEAAAAGTQLAAAKRQIGDLLADLEALREQKFGQLSADVLRQADQDRANAVRLDAENRELHLRIEKLERRLAVAEGLREAAGATT